MGSLHHNLVTWGGDVIKVYNMEMVIIIAFLTISEVGREEIKKKNTLRMKTFDQVIEARVRIFFVKRVNLNKCIFLN